VSAAEAIETFPCFGGSATVIVAGAGPAGQPSAAAARVRQRLLEWHRQFSRFEPESELSTLNGDPRETVPVSQVMARLIGAILDAARASGGLVDGTLVGEIERAGYAEHFEARSVPLAEALRRAAAGARSGRTQPAGEVAFGVTRSACGHGHAAARTAVRQRRDRQGPVL
jgi:thiamine biosynthesis lipoprotein ApbE